MHNASIVGVNYIMETVSQCSIC